MTDRFSVVNTVTMASRGGGPVLTLLSDAAEMITGSVMDYDQTVHGPYGAHPQEVTA